MTVDASLIQEQILPEYQQAQARIQQAETPLEKSYARANLGRIYLTSKQFELGTVQFEQAIALAQEQNDRDAEAEHIGTKGLALLEADKPGEACACFEQVLTLAETLDDNLYRSDALGNIGLALAAMGDPQPGLAKLNEALKLATTLHDSRRVMTHLGNIAHIYLQTGHAAEAVKYYYKAYTLAQQLFDTQSQTGYLNNIGVIFAQQSEYRRAAEAFETVLTLAQEAADSIAEQSARQYLVKCYTEIGPLDKLIEHIEPLLAITEDAALRRAHITALIERFFVIGNYQAAVDFLAQIIREPYLGKDKELSLDLLMNLGYAYCELDQLAEAIQTYESALSFPRQLDKPAVEAQLLGRLGSIYAEQGNLERSNAYVTGSIELARSLNDLHTVGELLCLLALNYRDLEQTAQALDYCEQAIEIFQKSDEHALATKALNLKLELQPEK